MEEYGATSNMKAYKLFRVRKDGTLGSLFIHRRQVIPVGVWLKAEPHLTKGYAFRPGWHCFPDLKAPHLTLDGRKWFVVEVMDYQRFPTRTGIWIVAQEMKVIGEYE